MGGLGLTGGILDAVVLGNALVRCLKGNEKDEILTTALLSRRDVWLNKTNPMSQGNYLRLCSIDPDVAAEREGFFAKLREDPTFARSIQAAFGDLLPSTFES